MLKRIVPPVSYRPFGRTSRGSSRDLFRPPILTHAHLRPLVGRNHPRPSLRSRDAHHAAARLTARELIGSRVRQEVERYNQSLPEVFRGLVQPEESEQILNGFRLKTKRPLDWEVQIQRACSSFERNGFLLLVDGQQVADLDAEIDLARRFRSSVRKARPAHWRIRPP